MEFKTASTEFLLASMDRNSRKRSLDDDGDDDDDIGNPYEGDFIQPETPSEAAISRRHAARTIHARSGRRSMFVRKEMRGLKAYVTEYCATTTMHGFRYLAESRTSCERYFWLTLLLLAICVCGVLISRILLRFMSHPVIVSFSNKESPINTVPFPAVTICPMTKTKRSIFNFTQAIYDVMDGKDITEEQDNLGEYLTLLCHYSGRHFRESDLLDDDFLEQLDNVKLDISEFADNCWYLNNWHDRCEKFFWPIIVDEGICYTFNMLDKHHIFFDDVFFPKDFFNPQTQWNLSWTIDQGYTNRSIYAYPYRAYLPGYDNGLHIEFQQSSSELDYLCLDSIQGFSILLHAPHVVPQMKKHHIKVAFGDAVIATVQPNLIKTPDEVRKYHPDIRECYFTNEKVLLYFKQYSPENCRLECITNYTLEICGCVNFHMPRNKSTPICGLGKYFCMKKAERDLKYLELHNSLNVGKAAFFCDCRPACVHLKYEADHSQSNWHYDRLYFAKQRKEMNTS
ncbi:unnamed protein product [Acanthoscelides obtectus]|uniref:Sodium channel protein Nach n=1 Tax=Acanthoscelides obtectus TaxID=200917 RepID=A0A9P0LBL5_ACAOB|nr:unnamed protein product [Acanthoscelides obtectus]CAK1635388.1 Pickpocket protein 28 [Acanthoscelides obtectus]